MGETAVAAEDAQVLDLLDFEMLRRKCLEHPAFLLDCVECVDSTTGEHFSFDLLTPEERALVARPREETGWGWQRAVIDGLLEPGAQTVVLKARQLGVSWLVLGLALWMLLTQPGVVVLVLSVGEDEASKLVNRLWSMLESLPPGLRNGTKVVRPQRGFRPFLEITLEHPDGRLSRVTGLASKPSAGHGETAGLVLLDEFARHPYASESWKALLPTVGNGGRLAAVSTANGTSNQLTGEGNFFHWLWVNAEDMGIKREFLKWDLAPTRDEDWYRRVAMRLPARDRAEQYPLTPEEAFVLTGDSYFDIDALAEYGGKLKQPVRRTRFVERKPGSAAMVDADNAPIRVLVPPKGDGSYALAADVATGRGKDYSAAYVIDLSNMELVAELHAKLDADEFAMQLHYLGRWYKTARLAVEMGGGYGEPVIISLRGGKQGRPAYPKLYRHRLDDRPDWTEMRTFGFPMNQKTRPQVINGLEAAIRERALPWMTDGLLMECRTFIHAKTNPSPRAQDGTNDDRVMAAAIVLDLYRQFGVHPKRKTRKAKSAYRPSYPWGNQSAIRG